VLGELLLEGVRGVVLVDGAANRSIGVAEGREEVLDQLPLLELFPDARVIGPEARFFGAALDQNLRAARLQ
jgi:hypothetical protein